MKGNARVLDQLQKLLAGELASRDQYFTHSRMYEDWGLTRLHQRVAHEFDDEMGHASALIERILFLEGTPDLSSRKAIDIGEDVPSMLKSDLNLEYSVVDSLKDAIRVCEKERDYQSREVLEKLLEDTEMDHAYWLEKQLGLIDRVGLENYLQSQTGE